MQTRFRRVLATVSAVVMAFSATDAAALSSFAEIITTGLSTIAASNGGIELSDTKLTMTEGKRVTIQAYQPGTYKFLSEDATWTTSDESVVALTSETGVSLDLLAISEGTATITATTVDGESQSCVVTVRPYVRSIDISTTSANVTVGDTITIEAEAQPTNAYGTGVMWKTSDSSVASINVVGDNVEVTGLKAGTATLTAYTQNETTATCELTVSPAVTEGIELSDTKLTMTEGKRVTIQAYKPGTYKFISNDATWTSSDESVVALTSSTGVSLDLLAISEGTATITATTVDGESQSCTVTVRPTVKSIAVSTTSASITVGNTITIDAAAQPANAYGTGVMWKTSDSSVASIRVVGDNVEVTGLKAGTATLTAYTENETKVEVRITVESAEVLPTGLTLGAGEALSIPVGSYTKLNPFIEPSNVSDKTVTWTTSDASVASVDSNGKVTGVSVGKATVTGTTVNGISAACVMTIYAKPTAISLDRSSLTMNADNSCQLHATITPSNASNQRVTWSSSNTSVATVSSDGTVIGVSAGTATITAKTYNGYTATCTVTIKDSTVEPTGITLNKSTLSVTAAYYSKLTATVTPSNATDSTVTWTSSDESIAMVTEKGTVIGASAGTATITATTSNGLTASCTVTVKALKVYPDSISMHVDSLSITEGYCTQMYPTILPENTTETTITWSSSDESVATVDSNGKVSAISAGTATITGKTVNNRTASCVVTVNAATVEPTGISLITDTMSIKAGYYTYLSATVTPTNASDKTVTWSSSNTSVATVDSNGKVTAISAGTATITAKTSNGYKATCTVTVKSTTVEPTSVSLSTSSTSLSAGSYTTLTATVTPSNASDQTVTWSSSNTSVATVDSNGKVTAVSAGPATITAKTSNGYTATCTVTVKSTAVVPTGISLNIGTLSLTEGYYTNLTATITPSNATNQTITWTSSDTSVATVSSSGKVTAVSAGTATITAKTFNGYKATCTITVKSSSSSSSSSSTTTTTVEPTAVKMNISGTVLETGDSTELGATVTPTNATSKTVTWSSSNTSVARVANGVVTAIGEGTATITAKTSNGCSDTCTVVVVDEIIFEIDQDDFTMEPVHTLILTATTNVEGADVTWTSDNDDVISINTASGAVLSNAVGTATLTAKLGIDHVAYASDTVTVTVVNPTVATSVTITDSPSTLAVGDTYQLAVDVGPHGVDQTVTWESSNSSVISVSSSGCITALASGKATITAYASDDVSGSITVTAVDSSDNIVFETNTDDGDLEIAYGEPYTIKYTVPSGVTVTSWSIASSYASVTADGVITGTKIGSKRLTAKLSNGNSGSVMVDICPNEEQKEEIVKTYIEELLYYTNIERSREGADPLELNDTLIECAQIRADEQIGTSLIFHTRPDGTSYYTVFDGTEFEDITTGENIVSASYASTGLTAEECVEAWMSSPGHRYNLLNERWSCVGFGVTFTSNLCTGGYIITALYAK